MYVCIYIYIILTDINDTANIIITDSNNYYVIVTE